MRSLRVGALVVATLAVSLLVLAGSAEARYMPYYKGYLAVSIDTSETGRHSGADRSSVGYCHSTSAATRISCEAEVQNDELAETIPGHRDENGFYVPIAYVYFHAYCKWTAVAHRRGRRVVVSQIGTHCHKCLDESISQ